MIQSKSKKKNSNSELFEDLINNQKKDIPIDWKLSISDMKRICKYINTSIFDEKVCCIWNGYITNIHNSNKGTYVNFYFQNKKVALHRLLYSNYVSPLQTNEYLKCNCPNKGVCCNINHYEKYTYSQTSKDESKVEKKQNNKKEKIQLQIINQCEEEKLLVEFD